MFKVENTGNKEKEMVIIKAMIQSKLHNHDVHIIGSCSIEGQVFTTCGTACPPTCSEPGPVPCTNDCIVGCQCPSGTVLDEVQKKCGKPDRCASLPW